MGITIKQACFQVPTSALNVTLLAFAAKRNLLPCPVLRRRCCWALGGRRCRSISAASTALSSSKPAAVACGGRMMGQTDRQTDGRPTVSSISVNNVLCTRSFSDDRERKCADTTGTVPVPWARPFPMLKYEYTFQTIYTETISPNSTRTLLRLEISKNSDYCSFREKKIYCAILIFSTLSFRTGCICIPAAGGRPARRRPAAIRGRRRRTGGRRSSRGRAW